MKNEVVKLSQSTAIWLECVRRAGVSDEQLLAIIRTGDVEPLQAVGEPFFKPDQWLNYAKEHGENLEQAVREGYAMTFNTINGLKMWLQFRFGLQADQHFQVGEGRFDGLQLSSMDVAALQAALAPNWVLIDHSDGRDVHEDEHEHGHEEVRSVTLGVRALLNG
ncbi:hypothetical protein [Paenibacillus sp. 481]|uniref:hypothetical protein n=1 Tax=Paenibacillus sp. 481 TaxID=2835869 RepID=UPI001E614693|nr:hypothetical protein [Paenibacillus sp. 481]UHA71850.1 hypothetical protein KIK04_13995 [Paenibacillus sp. 481]